MFQIKIDVQVKIAECPESGLPAIDFRREHGLSEKPTNVERIQVETTSEQICRRFAEFCNRDGDIIATGGLSGNNYRSTHSGPGNKLASAKMSGWSCELQHTVGIDAIDAASGTEISDADVVVILSALKAQAEANDRELEKYKAEREAEALRIEAKRAANQAEYDARCAAEKQAQAAERQAAAAEQSAWIRDHGSERLKRCDAEGIKCRAAFLDERLAAERPGWVWQRNVELDFDEPRNPPMEAFQMLDEARKFDQDAELSFFVAEDEDSEEAIRDYCATAQFCGEMIVFGLPKSITSR